MTGHTLPRMGRQARAGALREVAGLRPSAAAFPLSAGVVLGVGVGGFFDGIVFHQILQWHHMLSSAGYPPDSVSNLQVNTLADGLFHASTYLFVLWGLARLWRAARQPHFRWSSGLLLASMLMGFGLFNLVEGLLNHHILGLHHVNETAPRAHWIYWDIGFFLWGLAMLAGGWWLLRRAQARQFSENTAPGMLASAGSGPDPGPEAAPSSRQDVNLASESVAGEEDPGASLDMAVRGGAPGAGSGRSGAAGAVSPTPAPLNPGDEAAPGTPGTGENLCRECGGSGHLAGGATCPACGGTGKVTVGVGGA